jgi:hypothetical protein
LGREKLPIMMIILMSLCRKKGQMKKLMLTMLVIPLTFLANAAPASSTGHSDLRGVYKTYSRGLGDTGPASAKDTKIMFSVSGKAARDMFNATGPDVEDSCSDGTGTRMRKRDKENIVCTRSLEGVYSCNFGFDLKTGKSIGGIVC